MGCETRIPGICCKQIFGIDNNLNAQEIRLFLARVESTVATLEHS